MPATISHATGGVKIFPSSLIHGRASQMLNAIHPNETVRAIPSLQRTGMYMLLPMLPADMRRGYGENALVARPAAAQG